MTIFKAYREHKGYTITAVNARCVRADILNALKTQPIVKTPVTIYSTSMERLAVEVAREKR